MVTRLQIA